MPWRVGLALLAAGLSIGALQVFVGSGAEPALSPPSPKPVEARVESELLSEVSGRAWLLYLTRDAKSLPGGVAPVLAIGAEGAVTLVRGPPRSDEPRTEAWLAAGVVLPTASLDALSARQRASLLSLLATWSGGGVFTAAQIIPHGVRCPDASLAALLHWQR